MKNRDSAHPGRVKLTPVDAANGIYDLVRADEPRDPGTPLNKKLLDFAVAACGVTAGTATAYTLDDEFGGFELVDGAKVSFRLHVASGVNPTLNVNGTGAKALVDAYGAAIDEGIAAGSWIEARYSEALNCYVALVTPKYDPDYLPVDILAHVSPSGATAVEIPIPKEYKNITVDVFDIHSSGSSSYWNMELNVSSDTDYSSYTQIRTYNDDAVALDYNTSDGTISYGALSFMSGTDVAIPGLQAQVKMCFLGYKSAIIDVVSRYLSYTSGRPTERVTQTQLSDYVNDGDKTLVMRFGGSLPTGDIAIVVKGEK